MSAMTRLPYIRTGEAYWRCRYRAQDADTTKRKRYKFLIRGRRL